MRFPIILFIVATLAATELIAQESKIDSLVILVNKTKSNLDKARLLHKIVSIAWDYDFEKAYFFAKQEYDCAKKAGDAESLTIAYTDEGMYFYFTGDYKEASDNYQKAIEAANGKNFGEYPGYTLTRIGNLYRVQGEYDSAHLYYQRTEELLIQVPPGIALGSLYFHYGWMYEELSEFRKALGYLHRSLNIRLKIGDSLLVAECWREMATAHFGLNNIDSAKHYITRAMRVATKYADKELIIFTNINLGDVYAANNQPVEAIHAYEFALNELGEHESQRYKALALFHVGKVFDNRGEYLKAIEYYFEALRLNDRLKSRHETARIYGWIGWAYFNLRNNASALEYAQRSLELMKRMKDKAGEAFAHNLLGNIKFDSKEYTLALSHYDSSLQLRKSLQLNIQVANTLFNIARVYQAQKKYDEALNYYFDDLKFATSIGNGRIIAIANSGIGMLYAYKGDFANAEKYLKECQRLLKQNGLQVDRRDNFLNFARMYRLSNKQEKASACYEKYIELNDSVVRKENSMAAIQRDALYQLDKKEKEIEALNGQNALKESQIETQNERIRFQNMMIGLSALALVLVSVITYVLFRYYKTKTRANNELSKLNREIREQKEEIQAQSEELIEASQTIQEINRGLESAVEERTQQLKQAYQELDTFIYRSSHDFRRPLTTFMGLAEVAKISVKDSAAIELFSKVNETAHNLDRMLVKLQAVSQIASSDLILREITFDSELDVVLDLQRTAIVEKRIRIERRIGNHEPFLSYPLIVRIIFENLLENAVQFSSPLSPYVQVTIEQVGNEIKITLEDNGEGVAEEFHNRLFEMYFRANERSKGNGLGLYLVKKAVEKLEGRITFKGSPGQGSTFTVFLPYFER